MIAFEARLPGAHCCLVGYTGAGKMTTSPQDAAGAAPTLGASAAPATGAPAAAPTDASASGPAGGAADERHTLLSPAEESVRAIERTRHLLQEALAALDTGSDEQYPLA